MIVQDKEFNKGEFGKCTSFPIGTLQLLPITHWHRTTQLNWAASFQTFPGAAIWFTVWVIKCFFNKYIDIKVNKRKLESSKSSKTDVINGNSTKEINTISKTQSDICSWIIHSDSLWFYFPDIKKFKRKS